MVALVQVYGQVSESEAVYIDLLKLAIKRLVAANSYLIEVQDSGMCFDEVDSTIRILQKFLDSKSM